MFCEHGACSNAIHGGGKPQSALNFITGIAERPIAGQVVACHTKS